MKKKNKAERCNSHIPTEIVFEKILVRVPTKSLMRFKLVCKLWQSTILHDRRFHLSHRSLSLSRPSLLAFVGTYFPYKPAPPMDHRLARIFSESKSKSHDDLEKDPLSIENRFVCASVPSSDSNSGNWEKTVWEDYLTTEVVNGLVCFYSKKNIYLCNLSTSETMMLPPPSNKVYNHPYPYYLGFDEFNKVYKLIQIQKPNSYFDNSDNTKILTLKHSQNQDQDCWRNTSARLAVGFHRSYCFRSTLYWIVDFGLMCFDLYKEKYSTIPYPLDPDYDGNLVQAFSAPTFSMWDHHGERYYDSLEAGLTQVGGRLALTHSYVGATEFNIWLLDDNYHEDMLYPAWDKTTIHIPIHLRDPFSPSEISWSSFITIPAGAIHGTKKIVFTIGRSMLYKPLVGFQMPVYSYDLESETWETLDNNYQPPAAAAVAASSVQPAYKKYSQIYYFHEDNILPLKDILASK